MSLDRFLNKTTLLASKSRDFGQVYTDEDLKSLSYDYDLLVNFNSQVVVESHFYSTDGEYFESYYNTPYKFSSEYRDFLIDMPILLDRLDLISGTYKVGFNFLVNLLGDIRTQPFFLQEISPDRTELKLRIKLSYAQLFPEVINELNQFKNIAANLKASNKLNNVVVNFGSNNLFQLLNVKVECNDAQTGQFCQEDNEQNCSELVIYCKLYQPLLDSIEEKSSCFIAYKVINEVIDTFNVSVPAEVEQCNILRGPNFGNGNSINTDFEYWDSLLDTDAPTSRSLIRAILSGSDQIKLNLDYTSFGNFVTYGSATERLKNYNYKRQLLEYYDTRYKDIIYSGASGSTNIIDLGSVPKNRYESVLDSFDYFESYLHYETGSLFTFDVTGSITPAPKYVTGSKLDNYYVTSSEYQTWYNSLLSESISYDRTNYSSFYYNTPDHILRDPNNSQYVLFLHMIGQHFDDLYNYVDELTSIHRRDEHPQRGIPNKLLPYYIQSLGWKITNTRNLSDLWLYKLGTNQSGSLQSVTGSLVSVAHENLSEQIWRRIVNNLPFLLKTKGTSRSVRALFSSYGIPFTLISVKEYGGPQRGTDFNSTPNLTEDRFQYLLNFDGEQYIEFPSALVPDPFSPPGYYRSTNEIEFRFRTNYTQAPSMSLWAVEERTNRNTILQNLELVYYTSSLYGQSTYGQVRYTTATGNSGSLNFISASSDLLPLYDNDIWTVRLNLIGTYAKQVSVAKASDFIDGRISLSSSFSIDNSASGSLFYSAYEYFGGGYHYTVLGGSTSSLSQRFSGSLQAYKEYSMASDQSVFEEHVLNPASYRNSTYSSSYYTLTRYFTLGIDNMKYDHSVNTYITSSVPYQTGFSFRSGSMFNFTGSEDQQYSSHVETYYSYVPSVGGNVPKNNKIRIVDNSILNGDLAPDRSVQKNTHASDQKDSNRLAIVFSPTDQINRDVINQFGSYNFENFIGDPGDGEKDSYTSLNYVRNFYFSKYQQANDIGKYIELFSLYDYSVFKQLEQLIPARANLVAGVLIEPSILERPKIKRRFPSIIDLKHHGDLSGSITQVSSSYLGPLSVEIDPLIEVLIDRSKYQTEITTVLDVAIERSKYETITSFTASLLAERSKHEVQIERQDYVSIGGQAFYSGSQIAGTVDALKTEPYSSSLYPGILGRSSKSETQTFTYIRNGEIRTVTITDNKQYTLTGTGSLASNYNRNPLSTENIIGHFTVTSSGTPISDFDRNYLDSSSYTFTFSTTEPVINNYILTGPSFKEFLSKYYFDAVNNRFEIFRKQTDGSIIYSHISGSRTYPNINTVEYFYSSSGGSNLSDYERELQTAVSMSNGWFYSSSLKPTNYQHFESSRIGGCRFAGSKITGPGVNIVSTETVANTPVVIVTKVKNNTIQV